MEKLYKNKDWLYQKYIAEKLSTHKIAKICRCSKTTIRKWLTKYNIKIRTHFESCYRPLEERLWAKVDKKDNISECWPWTDCKNPSGHGRIGGENNGRLRLAHAVMYEIFYKDKVGKGEVVHHFCENPSCCNPFHLIKMTYKEHNSLHHKGVTINEGEKSYSAKLTWEEVRQIRKEHTGKRGEQIKLAEKYNVSCNTISKIINNKKWKE